MAYAYGANIVNKDPHIHEPWRYTPKWRSTSYEIKRTKKDKIKRTVLYQRPCQGGLNFPNVRTIVKALRLSWIGGLLSESND